MNELPNIEPGINVAEAMRSMPLDALETRILIGHALQLTRIQLITQSERLLSNDEAALLMALLRRRLQGEPIAYLIGEREFFGLTIQVTPDVLIPRHDTELLVELALERLPRQGRALDMGTGSGAIAVAITHARPDIAMMATDISEGALKVATHNAQQHGVQLTFLRSDWYAAFTDAARSSFDLIVSNPPYIVAGDVHLSQGDLRFEPIDALTDHADGLSALHTIADGAAAYLKPDGWLLMEHGYDQSEAVRNLLVRYGFAEVQSWRDLAGIERVSGGKYEPLI